MVLKVQMAEKTGLIKVVHLIRSNVARANRCALLL